MGAYNQFSRQHCCHNELLLTKYSRRTGALTASWSPIGAERTIRNRAALYGLDIEMGTETNAAMTGSNTTYDYFYLAKPFLEALKKGELPVSVLDDKVRRILRLNLRTNMASNDLWAVLPVRRTVRQPVELPEKASFCSKTPGTATHRAGFRQVDCRNCENATKRLTKGGWSSELKVAYEISPWKA